MSVLKNVELARSHNKNIPKLKKLDSNGQTYVIQGRERINRAGIEISQREMDIQDTKSKDCLIILEYT